MVTFVFGVFMFMGGNTFVAVQPPITGLSMEECTQMALEVNTSMQGERPLIGICAPRYEEAA
mgnify:CR=1 FL=1